jgi:hypothetical protein
MSGGEEKGEKEDLSWKLRRKKRNLFIYFLSYVTYLSPLSAARLCNME